MTIEDDILRSLRRITRAIDLYSRRLASKFGLTGPQLVCLRALEASGPSTPTKLAKQIDLSQATMTGILDRLESSGLVRRSRDQADRRRVSVNLTDAGLTLLTRAPSALQDSFIERLGALPAAEQRDIAQTLEKVVAMMGATSLDASAVLTTGPLGVSSEAVQSLLDEPDAAAAGGEER